MFTRHIIPTKGDQESKTSSHAQSPPRSDLEEETPTDEATEEEEDDGSYFVVAGGMVASPEEV